MLEGKTAWITGGGSGIGEAAARALAAAGAHVVVSGRRADALGRVVDEIAAAGGAAEAAPLDVVDADAAQAVVEAIASARGGVDILVANAGRNIPNRALAAVSARDFAQVVDLNLNGVMNCVLAVLPGMRAAGGGTLILTSSWAGRHISRLTGPAYTASKHAVVALSHAINIEECAHGIRCTALMPGEVATPIMRDRPTPPSEADMARMLQAEDLGATVRFIAEAPAHVCFNEVMISPTWNRFFVGFDEASDVET
ncbi:SDR family oxidoreductase [Pikeienuella sp. HZG-20]|uniref:SDR family oxidoreductase n=1 Tax=Paludibacillus litoralis TaxID=3133267 RepID=UPI0030EEE8C6